MDFVQTEGDSIDEAIEKALAMLGVQREKITVDILSEGRKGILGFGAQKARIRASLRKSGIVFEDAQGGAALPEQPLTDAEVAAIAEKAKAVLTDILALMGVKAAVETILGRENEETILNVRTGNSGLLIGRKGQTLEALQYLLTRIISVGPASAGSHIIVDIENYQERRRKSLQDMALRLGEKAKRQRKTVTVEALSAADRRIIHAALQDDPWVTTKSLGQGPYRRLLIIPEGDRKKKEEIKPAAHERPGTRVLK